MDILEFLRQLQEQKIVDHQKAVQECIEAIEKMPLDKALVLMGALATLMQRMNPQVQVSEEAKTVKKVES